MKDQNLKGCRFSADTVPYMYGELAAGETLAFESHLLECGTCTDEFAAVSSARFEVYDWKKLEFDTMPTPLFEIPYGEIEPSISWIEKLRVAFIRPWAVPGLAFAGLAVVTVLAASIYFSVNSATHITENRSDIPEVRVASTPGVAVVLEPPASVVDDTRELKRPSETGARPVPAVTVRTSQPKRAVRRGGVAQPKVAPMQTADKRVPRLNEFNDDEDTSLRLAQLFEDIDTRQ